MPGDERRWQHFGRGFVLGAAVVVMGILLYLDHIGRNQAESATNSLLASIAPEIPSLAPRDSELAPCIYFPNCGYTLPTHVRKID